MERVREQVSLSVIGHDGPLGDPASLGDGINTPTHQTAQTRANLPNFAVAAMRRLMPMVAAVLGALL